MLQNFSQHFKGGNKISWYLLGFPPVEHLLGLASEKMLPNIGMSFEIAQP